MIPQIYYRVSDSMLKDSYSLDEIKKIYETNKNISSSKDCFFNLMKAAGVDEPTLLGAFESPTDSAKHTYEKRVEKKITSLVTEFNNYYGQEKISIDFKISSNVARLYIVTEDKYMSFSERSNGLKWYFSLFVNTKAETTIARPIIYLLDEPGVHLHVRAQKKLLELFGYLCKPENQVIYTTHSPFMIDGNNVFNVRPIEKDETGISHIWRSTTSHKLRQGSKLETLSPLIESLGMDLEDNIGPQFGNLNIVVEGPTDCMYITAMLHFLKIPNTSKPNVIPCAGVDNVNRVVSILIGWGCEYKVILDYDAQGYKQYKLLTKETILANTDQVFFVNLKTANNSTDVQKPNNETTESLVAKEDNDKLTTKYDGTNDTKTLAAKEFHDNVIRGKLVPSDKTCENFKRLFLALGIYD